MKGISGNDYLRTSFTWFSFVLDLIVEFVSQYTQIMAGVVSRNLKSSPHEVQGYT